MQYQAHLILFTIDQQIWPGLTEFGPPMWQAEADTVNELILSVLPATAGGQILLTMAKFC